MAGLTRRERLRREAMREATSADAERDMDELGSDAAYAWRAITNPPSEREALLTRVKFALHTLHEMLDRGADAATAQRYVDSLDPIVREATIRAFNLGAR